MTQNSNNIEAVGAVRPRPNTLRPEDLVPGTLTQWADQNHDKSWTFVGDGETSGTQVVSAAIDQETRAAAQDPETHPDAAELQKLQPFAQQAAAALFNTAQPDAPIAQGDVKEFSLKQMLQLVEPFLRHYASQESGSDTGTQNSMGFGEHKKTIGSVNSMGLSIPLTE